MIERQDRRASGVNRVSVARLVDICGRDASVPAFEAESIELSGRGMHVRTPYLPPLGAPLVCRLEDQGREIVVEGVVAWQQHVDGGGEFGVQFTALDSGSVEALKSMCGIGQPAATVAPAPVLTPDPSEPPAPAGLPVKLHIDGLGAPMKARVRTGSTRKLQVGSNLEFLKVGRGLEIEGVEKGERRGARIDAVSIAIDPETQVPQLVVALRYEGEDTTPEPSVIAPEEEAAEAGSSDPVEPSEASPPVSVDAADDGDACEDEESPALRGKVDAFAVSVGKAAKSTGEKLAAASGSAASGFSRWAAANAGRLVDMIKKRESGKRRSTAKAPATAAAGARRLRPQNGGREVVEQPGVNRRKLIAAAGGASVLSIAIGAIALTGHSSKSGSSAATPSSVAVAGASGDQVVPTSQPGAPVPTPAAVGMAQVQPGMPGSTGVQPNPALPNGAVPGASTPGASPGQRPGVVANVPLFGPTPMATLEPAPLGPSPDQIGVAPQAAAQHVTEERMDDEEDKPSAEDESFTDSSKKEKSEKSADAKAEEVKPWVVGKLHLPVVYRMKLDKPGSAIKGKSEASGFSVVIPGRKVEGSGAAIIKRDDRIANVHAKNGPSGAQVSFVFRSKVPSYKVRLRKSYVEFFVSSPDGAK